MSGCCKAQRNSREYAPCDKFTCCCVPSRASDCGFCQDRAIMGIRPPGTELIPEPIQVKDTRVTVDLNGIHKELIELNKNFRRYFRKKRKRK